MSEQRRRAITDRVRAAGHLGLTELARDLGVSEMTVRRDLDELTRRGELVRVRGGARAVDHDGPPPLPTVLRAAPAAGPRAGDGPAGGSGDLGRPRPGPVPAGRPRRASSPLDELFGGRRSAVRDPSATPAPSARSPRSSATSARWPAPGRSGPRLVRDAGEVADSPRAAGVLAEQLARSSTAVLDAGSSVRSLARALVPRLDPTAPDRLQVITRDPAVADELAGAADVLLTGGASRSPGAGLSGPWALAPLTDVHADVAVLAITALDATGWWCPSPEDLAWARAARDAAGSVLALLPAASVGRRAGVRGGDLDELSLVVVAGALDLAEEGVAATVTAAGAAGTRLVLEG